jgi:hypothetical protein
VALGDGKTTTVADLEIDPPAPVQARLNDVVVVRLEAENIPVVGLNPDHPAIPAEPVQEDALVVFHDTAAVAP